MIKNETAVTNGERPKGKGWVLKAIESSKFVWARKVMIIG